MLGKVDMIGLLPKLAAEVIVPDGVAREIDQGPPDDPSRIWLDGAGRSLVRPVIVSLGEG
jgi:hypothetical protein